MREFIDIEKKFTGLESIKLNLNKEEKSKIQANI